MVNDRQAYQMYRVVNAWTQFRSKQPVRFVSGFALGLLAILGAYGMATNAVLLVLGAWAAAVLLIAVDFGAAMLDISLTERLTVSQAHIAELERELGMRPALEEDAFPRAGKPVIVPLDGSPPIPSPSDLLRTVSQTVDGKPPCRWHRWETVRSTSHRIYRECSKCHRRRAQEVSGMSGWQPVDRQWLDGGDWTRPERNVFAPQQTASAVVPPSATATATRDAVIAFWREQYEAQKQIRYEQNMWRSPGVLGAVTNSLCTHDGARRDIRAVGGKLLGQVCQGCGAWLEFKEPQP